ncbi:MAG: Amino acid transporter [Devosia sp.]|nr:Amino acid transporter [Devosia sp.]
MIKLRYASIMSGLIASICICAAPQSAHGQSPTIRIAIEGNFPPFNYLDSQGDLQGFDVEIANALCASMAAQCELMVQDWDAMIEGLVDNKYDAVVSSMSMSAERREKAGFTSRYYDSPSVFITGKASSLQSFEPSDLTGTRLGVTLSTSQEAFVKNLYSGSTITVFGSSPELYQGLANGEVEVILEDKLAAYDWLTNTKAGECCQFRGGDIKDPTYFGDGAGIAVRKEDKDLREAFDGALAAITLDGTYNLINAKYFPFSIR